MVALDYRVIINKPRRYDVQSGSESCLGIRVSAGLAAVACSGTDRAASDLHVVWRHTASSWVIKSLSEG